MPELADAEDEQQEATYQRGTEVGDLARQLFPGGANAQGEDPWHSAASVKRTEKMLPVYSVIYEAAFMHEGVLCAVDMLVRKGNKYYAYEVKSTSEVKPQHVMDAALQYWVLKGCGLNIADFSIVYLNTKYERNGPLHIDQLFTATSVLDEITKQQKNIAKQVEALKGVVKSKTAPEMEIGPHCEDPYPCNFMGHCWKDFPEEDHVFTLSYGPGWELFEEGYRHLNDIPEDYPLKDRPAFQLKHYRSGEVHHDAKQLEVFKKKVKYPLYFLDFETFQPPVPPFDKCRPYQQIPFQFSLHIQQKEGALLQHVAYLGNGADDPREGLMIKMIESIGTKGTLVAWNVPFERSRIAEMAKQFPQYAKPLEQINARWVDLMEPFKARHYYHPDFEGSASIKKVLPVLVPDMRYDTLEIGDGGMASMRYAQLPFMDESTRNQTREALLTYCHQDTLAMVKIWEWMNTR